MVAVIDYAGSYMTFFGHDRGNIARIQLDAACTLTSVQGGTAEWYYLIAPCRAERMYRDSTLLPMPNDEFCGIIAADECVLICTHWRSDRDNREPFADMHLGIRTPARIRAIRQGVRPRSPVHARGVHPSSPSAAPRRRCRAHGLRDG
jgi:hypothetical protein